MKTPFKFAALALAVVLTGCASHRPVQDASVPSAIRTQQDAGVSEMDVAAGFDSKDMFIVRTFDEVSTEVPFIQLPALSITESGVYDAMSLVAAAAGMSLRVEGGPNALERAGSGAVFGVSGAIADVLNTVSDQIGFFWRIKGKTLIVEQDRQFIVDLPPIYGETDSMAGVTNTLQRLGAREVFLDREARSLTFRADKKALGKIQNYLYHYRTTRSMIVYDIDVWQVTLNDDNSKGIDWAALSWTGGAASIGLTNLTSPAAAGVGLQFAKGKFDASAVVRFLETQGTVKTLSHPRLTVMSGGKGKLSVGQTTDYVSKVGTNSGTALNQTTVETKTLTTGLQMALAGDYSDNTVYTKLNISLADLLRFNSFTALGTELKLPQTQARQLETVSRARPGDTVLLGGMTLSNESIDSVSGLASTSRASSRSRTELVIAIQSRVVRFNGSKEMP